MAHGDFAVYAERAAPFESRYWRRAMPVISWLLQPIMAASAFVAAWFVAEDSANFGVVQMAAAVLIIVSLVGIATFWRPLVDWLRGSRASGGR
jgi:hypothetical protein